MTYTRKVHTTANIRYMSETERRAYNRERAAEYRARKLSGATKDKPEQYECHTCKRTLPFNDDNFGVADKSAFGLRKICRDCTQARQRSAYYKHYYDLTDEQVRQATEGGCQICGGTHGIKIDHCHTTNKVRGGLCNKCNTGLGFFNDDPNLMRAAAVYVEMHKTA